MIIIQGKIVEQITEVADMHIDMLAKKYLGIEKYQDILILQQELF
jgi:hypothetical protein